MRANSFLLLCIGFLFAGCKENPLDSAPVYQCHLATNQIESFFPRLDEYPLSVNFDPSLSKALRQPIEEAIDEWNRFTQESFQKDLFTFDPSSDSKLKIVEIKSKEEWASMTFKTTDSALAAVDKGQHYRSANQTAYFNAEAIPPAQIKTIALHELGHAFGLRHSCQNSDRKNPYYAHCSEVKNLSPYHLAVMYPSVLIQSPSHIPEVKPKPRQNDRERAYCFLEPVLNSD